MQRERLGREAFYGKSDPFSSCQRFSSFPSIFGGRDPFDDPFFTRPTGSMFSTGVFGDPSIPSDEPPHSNNPKGVVIEELDSDEEVDAGMREDTNSETDRKDGHPRNAESLVEHPDDDDDDDAVERTKTLPHKSDWNRVEGKQNQGRSFSAQSRKVTYGGVDGAYYTSTRTRRMGSDGVMLEESKEADTTTGQATHKISRGIHDKGHSITRKLNSDGKVNMMQTLHNLNEDELADFEKEWKNSGREHSRGWHNDPNFQGNAGASSEAQRGRGSVGGWALPSVGQTMRSDSAGRAASSARSSKKVVRINID